MPHGTQSENANRVLTKIPGGTVPHGTLSENANKLLTVLTKIPGGGELCLMAH